jgi:hypothetical protein
LVIEAYAFQVSVVKTKTHASLDATTKPQLQALRLLSGKKLSKDFYHPQRPYEQEL